MREFDDIYLSWRPGQGSLRNIVGVLRKDAYGKFSFRYEQSGVEKAMPEGFSSYTEFPDLKQVYNGVVLDVFAQRLMKSERSDIQTFYDFWEIDPQKTEDKFYLLGHTQGLLPTDNFEFLADYNYIEGLHFLTDLAHVSDLKLASGSIQPGDILTYQLDGKNQFDDKAVIVFKGTTEVGYIKRIHSRVFHKMEGVILKLTVKALDQNGIIKRIFVKVEN